jgi:dCTP deaminase
MSRLREKDDRKQLVVTPLLDAGTQIGPGSIDLRLGTSFILFKHAEISHVKSGEELRSPPKSIELVKKDFGEHFVLHPSQFALADTFEFIALPADLCAYVTSRSRYGRAGLVIATAIYIHPFWRGFLTLELQNCGTVPINLECGSRVAQIIISDSQISSRPDSFAEIPTGPSFPSLRDKRESPLLDEFRRLRTQSMPHPNEPETS